VPYSITRGSNFSDKHPHSQANTQTAGYELPCLLLKPNVYYSIQTAPPLDSVLTHKHKVHTLIFYFFKYILILVFQLYPSLESGPFHSQLAIKIVYFISLLLLARVQSSIVYKSCQKKLFNIDHTAQASTTRNTTTRIKSTKFCKQTIFFVCHFRIRNCLPEVLPGSLSLQSFKYAYMKVATTYACSLVSCQLLLNISNE